MTSLKRLSRKSPVVIQASFLMLVVLFFQASPMLAHAVSSEWIQGAGLERMTKSAFTDWASSLEYTGEEYGELLLLEPVDGVVVPANSASPFIHWQSDASTWVVRLTAADDFSVKVLCSRPYWEPDDKTWQELISRSAGAAINLEVFPVGGVFGRSIGAGKGAVIYIDEYSLDAPIGYLQMPLPFRKAQQHPEMAQWRKGEVSTAGEPDTFLTNLPVCANCHTYSADGSSVAFDIDIDGDKSGFIHSSTAESIDMMRVDQGSWNQLSVNTSAPISFGLFASLSSSGRYLVGTVGEVSLFVMIDHHDFSQMFFPVTGQIAVHDRDKQELLVVPGTDNPAYVHTGPRLSPDDQTLVFSRAPVKDEYVDAVLSGQVHAESSQQNIQQLNVRYPFQFDLYTLPFPSSDEAIPQPLVGASNNGMSNFFPRFSPDGRWIVFTRSPTGLVGQPDSELWVIPASGGEARRLSANTPIMNSWHSFSPDGRWLVFSGKGQRAETQTFLARFYEDGTSPPALRLQRFSLPEFANVTPEFLPGRAAQIKEINFLIEQDKQQTFKNNTR